MIRIFFLKSPWGLWYYIAVARHLMVLCGSAAYGLLWADNGFKTFIHWLRVTPGMNIGLLQYRRKIS